MAPEPKCPPASASDSDYQAYLLAHQQWTIERCASKPSVTDDSMRDALEGVLAAKRPADLALVPRPPEPDWQPPPELTTWWLPEAARDWCEAAAVAYAVPRTLPVAAVVCAMATALQGRTTVIWKPGVEEPLSLYWFVFSATGTRKSALLSRATQAITARENQLAEAAAQQGARIAHEREWRSRQLTNMMKRKAPSKHTSAYQEWQAQMLDLKLELDKLVIPKSPRWLVSDVNPSLLPKLFKKNYESEGIARLSAMIDEGSFVENMLGRHQGATMVETVLGAINGAPLRWVRASSSGDDPVEVSLPHSHMTICALIQPDFYERLAGVQKLKDCGFIGRCFMQVIDEPSRRPAWDAPAIPDGIQEAWDALLTRLLTEDVPECIDMTIDAAERQAVREVYEAVETDGTGASQRITGLLARIVAICEVAERVEKRVDRGPKTKGREEVGDTISGQAFLPKNSNEYDWLDDEEKEQGTRDTPDPPRDTLTYPAHGFLASTSIIKEIFNTLYRPYLLAIRAVDAPSRPVGTQSALYPECVRRAVALSLVPSSADSTLSVSRLHHTWPGRIRPSSSELYRTLELMEDNGVIEWVTKSERKNQGERRYTLFFLVGEHAKKPRAPSQPPQKGKKP